ncbi:hypothetical protein SDC9_175136 [bioreactor metagenome]|uniref:Uncharacterized protein n=1 Tax=bioreactor metagenome TaxID=1076179 RepID=A0A645GP71_9ZZZZ
MLSVHLHVLQAVAQNRAEGGNQPVHPHVHAAASGQIFPGNPLRSKAHLINTDVLIGDQHVSGGGASENLLHQQIRLSHPQSGGKGPIGPHALRRQRRIAADGGVIVPSGSHQPPEPRQSRG